MKHTKRIVSLMLAVLLMFSGAAAVLAQEARPEPADNVIDTSAYVKTVIESPKVKKANAVKFVQAANILMDLDSSIKDSLSQDLLTGSNVIGSINGIIEAISRKLESDPSLGAVAGFIKFLFTTDLIAQGLAQDKRFASAVAKLQKASADGYLTIPDVVENGVNFTSADFGFDDGDAYSFFDAFVCSLSEILTQLDVRNMLGDFTDSVKNGEYVVGNYNLFVPVYELLELEPVSSVEFTQLVEQAVNGETENSKLRLRTVANLTLKPVADLLTKIENGGVDTVIELLPKLLYALDSGMVNELVRNLLKDKSLFYVIQFNDMLENLDLDRDFIWNMIDKKYITGSEEEPAGFDFDKDGINETTLPLTREQFDAVVEKLDFAAEPSVKASVSSTEKNRLALETDKALVSEILCDAVVEFLETGKGAAFAKKAVVSGIEKEFAQKIAAGCISMFTSTLWRTVLAHTQSLIAFAAPSAARMLKFVNGLTPA